MAANETSQVTEVDKIKQGFYTIAFVLGTIGNILVLIVVAGRRERRTVNDIFILNLAIADLTYLFLCLPTNFYLTVGRVHSEFYCRFVWQMMTLTICISIFTLTSMAIHRRQVILNPFKPEIKHRYLFLWILSIWGIGFLAVLPSIIVTKAKPVEPYGCEEKWPSDKYRKAYTAFLFTVQYALPLLIIAVEYVRIGRDLFKPKGARAKGDRKRVIDPARRKENMQVIKTLATIVTLFALTMLPAQLAWMLIDFGDASAKKVGFFFLRICEWLLYTHACLNPIVYGSVAKHYRRDYIKYITAIVCCRWKSMFENHDSDDSPARDMTSWDDDNSPPTKRGTSCFLFKTCKKKHDGYNHRLYQTSVTYDNKSNTHPPYVENHI